MSEREHVYWIAMAVVTVGIAAWEGLVWAGLYACGVVAGYGIGRWM